MHIQIPTKQNAVFSLTSLASSKLKLNRSYTEGIGDMRLL